MLFRSISNLRTPARWLQRPYQDPGGGRGHFALPNAPTSGVEEWCCWALGALCAEALRWSENNCKVLDYANISPATVCEVAEVFGIARPLDFMERVQAVFGEDAKRKGRKFEADAESKRGDATDTMLQATQRWVDPLYGQLRAKAGIR